MACDVFISFTGNDEQAALDICRALEHHGISCWIAPRDIRYGDDYAAAIVAAISNAKALLLVFSAAANQSRSVRNEVERAFTKNILLIPVRIEDAKAEGSLEYFLSLPQWFNAFPRPLEKYLDDLAARVRSALDLGGGAPAPPERELAKVAPPRRSWLARLPRKPLPYAAAILTAAFVLFGTWLMMSGGVGSLVGSSAGTHEPAVFLSIPAMTGARPDTKTAAGAKGAAPLIGLANDAALKPEVQSVVAQARAAEREARAWAAKARDAQSQAWQTTPNGGGAEAAETNGLAVPEGYWNGQLEQGMPDGYGRFTWSSGNRKGDRFEGQAVHGAMSLGVYFFSNGNRFEGQFESSRPSGYGVLVTGIPTAITTENAGLFKAGYISFGVIDYKDQTVWIGHRTVQGFAQGCGVRLDKAGAILEQGSLFANPSGPRRDLCGP